MNSSNELVGLAIEELAAGQFDAVLDELAELLRDAVDSGASVGFLPPLAVQDALAYWQEVAAAVQSGSRVALVARQDGRIVGSAQLDLPGKPNARHRAEVQKLLVHSAARGRGIGRRLLAAVEKAALNRGRTLLVLDTQQGSVAEWLYARHGYTRAGEIPQYAEVADGSLITTVLFYRVLER
jgi:ribosomal protein S18 acetylase RimI-like enzyme